MRTERSADEPAFEGFAGRKVIAGFDGGAIISDAGVLLLRPTERAIRLFDRVVSCGDDRRNPGGTVHSLRTLIGQRIAAIALDDADVGYEHITDHDTLRHDPVLALLSDRLTAKRANCGPLAGKSTLNRLEHASALAGTGGGPTRDHRIAHDKHAVEDLVVELFLEAHGKPPREIMLDLDATDDPIHGHQEGRFFHGYYSGYWYLPLCIFCGRHLLAAKLRRSNIDASAGALEEVERIVNQIRKSRPRVCIVLRADRAASPVMTC